MFLSSLFTYFLFAFQAFAIIDSLPGEIIDKIADDLTFEETVNLYTLNRKTHICRKQYLKQNKVPGNLGLGKVQKFKIIIARGQPLADHFLYSLYKIFHLSSTFGIPLSLYIKIDDSFILNSLEKKLGIIYNISGKCKRLMNTIQISEGYSPPIRSIAYFIEIISNIVNFDNRPCIRKIIPVVADSISNNQKDELHNTLTQAFSKELLSLEALSLQFPGLTSYFELLKSEKLSGPFS